MRLELGCPVHCADDAFGDLADVVIDPGAQRVTHLVVQPHERHDLARLVPIGRAQLGAGSGGRISLDCTVGELNEVEPLHDFAYVRLGERPLASNWDVGIEEISQMPLSGSLGVNALGAGMEPIGFDDHGTLSYDRIPKGTVELRSASEVTSSDGHHVGHVVGLVIDETQQISQLVLEHGHLWGKREIEIPIGSIDRIESDEVLLAVAHDDVVG
jgi:sporulation protein YlmC with PRC-barrel domain